MLNFLKTKLQKFIIKTVVDDLMRCGKTADAIRYHARELVFPLILSKTQVEELAKELLPIFDKLKGKS